MKYFIVFVIGTIACINGAPTADVAQDSDLAELKAALEPVQSEIRSMVDNAQFAVKDLTEQALKSANDLSASAKDMLNPKDRSSSQNVMEQAKSLANEAQDMGRALLVKAVDDYQPIKLNQKSAFITSGDAVKMLEEKFLTKDGQDLVKALTTKIAPPKIKAPI